MSVMALNKLVFDTSNMAESANVGAYLRGSDGTLITQTSGKLDVQIGNTSIAVTGPLTDTELRATPVPVSGTVSTTPAGATSAAYGATSVGNTATDIIGTDLTGRVQVMLQNKGNKDVFIGSDNSVTISTGILLAVGATMVLDAAAAINVHGITASGTSDVRYFELAV